jgi:hypothetical protein
MATKILFVVEKIFQFGKNLWHQTAMSLDGSSRNCFVWTKLIKRRYFAKKNR